MPWYEEWFDREEYELVYRKRDEEEAVQVVDLIERIADPPSGARLLDVGCGRGRHARIMTRRGYRVTGIDLSTRAIQEARRRASAGGLSIDFHQQDMREPAGTEAFDGAVNLFSSFGYFEKEDDHQKAIRAITQALRPGGFFVQDFMNAPHVRSTLVPESTRAADGMTITERRWTADGRINKEITLARNGRKQTFTESVRLLTLKDFRRLYRRAGLELKDTFGDYTGAPYAEDRPRLILLSRKAQD